MVKPGTEVAYARPYTGYITVTFTVYAYALPPVPGQPADWVLVPDYSQPGHTLAVRVSSLLFYTPAAAA